MCARTRGKVFALVETAAEAIVEQAVCTGLPWLSNNSCIQLAVQNVYRQDRKFEMYKALCHKTRGQRKGNSWLVVIVKVGSFLPALEQVSNDWQWLPSDCCSVATLRGRFSVAWTHSLMGNHNRGANADSNWIMLDGGSLGHALSMLLEKQGSLAQDLLEVTERNTHFWGSLSSLSHQHGDKFEILTRTHNPLFLWCHAILGEGWSCWAADPLSGSSCIQPSSSEWTVASAELEDTLTCSNWGAILPCPLGTVPTNQSNWTSLTSTFLKFPATVLQAIPTDTLWSSERNKVKTWAPRSTASHLNH